MNESYAIAAVVAARLGLQRVMPVDNHTADAVQADMPATCSDAITRMWQSPTAAALQADDHAAIAAVRDGQGMLAYYQSINRPERLRRYIDVDQRAAVGGGGAGECGRRYLAWWETRNLHMVANIRAASGAKPGARVLNIVGASHKPYYDQYLAMMSDVVLVDAEQVLR